MIIKKIIFLLATFFLSEIVIAQERFFTNFVNQAAKQISGTQRTVHQEGIKLSNSMGAKPERAVSYAGYSLDFMPIKSHLVNGQVDLALSAQKQKINESPVFLDAVEYGAMALSSKNLDEAIESFAAAEDYLKHNMDRTIVEDSFFNFGGEFVGILTGKGDLTEYKGAPFERILMLNYKSIAYLLKGDRRAYNVTRRAIDWQLIEEKEFKKKLAATQESIKKEEKAIEEKTSSQSVTANPINKNLFSIISQEFSKSERKALSVESAYVNPFAYYMAGIVQEFDSFDDPLLRENAKISYKKAYELNKKSRVLKQAYRDSRKKPRRNRRLVQVVVADGFAPEKKELMFPIPMVGGYVPVKLPLYEAVNTRVSRIRIKSKGKTLSTLSLVSDIEALTMRHQLDSLPFEYFKVVSAIARSASENIVWSQMGALGMVGKMFRESFAHPDMRSWMTLPKRLMASRLYVSKYTKKLEIVSYDQRGKVMAKKEIHLNPDGHSFVYARSMDNNLLVNVNDNLWVAAK